MIKFKEISYEVGAQLTSEDVDLINKNGAFGITYDKENQSLLHKLTQPLQALYASRIAKQPTEDSHFVHGMLIYGCTKKDGLDRFLHMHAVKQTGASGIRSSNGDYLNAAKKSYYVTTKLHLFVPEEESFSALLRKHAEQSGLNSQKLNQTRGIAKNKVITVKERIKFWLEDIKNPWEMGAFSTFDMLRALFHRRPDPTLTEKAVQERIAGVVVDLLAKPHTETNHVATPLLNKNGRPRSFYCMGYATLVTQATIVIHAMQETRPANWNESDTRQERIEKMRAYIFDDKSSLAYTAWSANPLCTQVNGRFAMSGHVFNVLKNGHSSSPPTQPNS